MRLWEDNQRPRRQLEARTQVVQDSGGAKGKSESFGKNMGEMHRGDVGTRGNEILDTERDRSVSEGIEEKG